MGEGIWGMQLGSFPQYILMYAIGIRAAGSSWEKHLEGIKPVKMILLLSGLIILLPLFMLLGEDSQLGLEVFMGGLYWQAAFYALWESAMCILMSLAVLALMYQKGPEQTGLLKTISRSSYGVYIIHPPVLVFISVAAMSLSIHPLLKFALIGSIAISASYLIAGLLVKIPGVRRVI